MPTRRLPRGQTGSRPSLGIGKMFGLFGGGDITGGTIDSTPSVDVYQPQGPTQDGSRLPAEYKFSPGTYTPATVKNPFMDRLSGGYGAARAANFNDQTALAMQQIAAQQAELQARLQAEQFAAQNRAAADLNLEGTRSKNALELANRNSDLGVVSKFGLTSEALPNFSARINPHALTRAEAEVGNAAKFATEPQGVESQRINYNASLRAPAAENYAKLRTPLTANSDVFLPGGYSGMDDQAVTLHGPRETQGVEEVPQPIMDASGKVIAYGPPKVQRVSSFSEAQPPSVVLPPEERQRREMERLKAVEGMRSRMPQVGIQPMPSNPGLAGGAPYGINVQAFGQNSRPVIPNLGAGNGALPDEQLRQLLLQYLMGTAVQ